MHVNDLLKTAVDNGASDLHLKVGSVPVKVMVNEGGASPVLEEVAANDELQLQFRM